MSYENRDMIDLGNYNKKFDIVYMSSVIEHSPDLRKTFSEISRVANSFYINMFKWKFKTGGVISRYHSKSKHYSTYFNIEELMSLLKEFGSIEQSFISGKSSGVWDFNNEYKNKFEDINRNGKFLTLIGSFK